MPYKFYCDKFSLSRSGTQKETPFQKYLRLRNEQIMAKCFDVKKESTVVPSNETASKQLEKLNNKMLPGQLRDTDCKQEKCEHMHPTVKAAEEVLLAAITETTEESETFLKTKKRSESATCKNNMQSLSLNRHLETSSKKLNNSGHSKNSLNSNRINSNQSKHLTSTSNWKSPFRTFTTNGLRTRPQSSQFAYDLSRDELKFAGHFSSAMKPAKESERQLLKSGLRRDYLTQRYEHSPVVKYNYPEATSWRIGWLQQNQ